MTNVGIDEVLNRLSVKFNRIFYDRDFVGCVSQDLQIVINNKNKCCVLVFPSLSPNYLRVIRYQAKLCDLAVISLGSGSAKSLGVCLKKYFLPIATEENTKKEDSCSTQMAENPTSVTKKKRPPIQLYVPPAQRKSRLVTTIQKDDSNLLKNSRKATDDNFQYALKSDKKDMSILNTNNDPKEICFCTEDIGYFFPKKDFSIPYFSYQCNCVKFFLFKDIFPYAKLLIFSIKRKKHSFHWIKCLEGNLNLLIDDVKFQNWATLNKIRTIFKKTSETSRKNLFMPNTLDFREFSNLNVDCEAEYRNSYCLSGNRIFLYLPDHIYYCYQSLPDFENFHDGLKPADYLHDLQDKEEDSSHIEEYFKNIANSIQFPQTLKREDIDIDSLLVDRDRTESPQMPLQKDISNCDNSYNVVCANERNNTSEEKSLSKQVDRVIVLDERIEAPKIGSKSAAVIKDKTRKNEHEQEKEIMRKAKQNINRKTRPIIKYVDDDNDTLNIGKGDNINNWEDLFNDEGELQEDIFTEIVQKVGHEVTIVKATEDYSAYASKQIEEFEHMVELYDFPATLETHDLISAFSELNSDSMYVKWVDDTHALLVLGSYTQAQKAIELSNPLIKVRPMSAASSLALEKANQFDLKPAMKRPQTNLQTARRLITSHLGAKSKVSKEQSAKEREDLRVAKELKKQAKQNEKDAWEGNLRSTIN